MIADTVEAPAKPKCPPRNPTGKAIHDWQAVRQFAIQSGKTAQQIADKFGIPLATVQKRMANEGWRKDKNRISSKSVEIAINRAVQAQSGEAEMLVQRSLNQTNRLLDHIDEVIASKFEPVLQPDGTIKETSADQLSKVTGSWQKVIQVGRQAHGLDNGPSLHVVKHVSECGPIQQAQVIDVEPVAQAIVVESPTSAIESSS